MEWATDDARRRRQPGGLVGRRPASAEPTTRHGSADRRRRSARATTDIGVSVTTTIDVPADAWWAPIETISNSEDGFERVYQGSALLLSWPVRLGCRRALVADASSMPSRRPSIARGRRREPPGPGRPRPLLPAAAARPVHRHDAARPDRRAGARLERAHQRRLLPPERRARQPRRDVVEPRADARRLAGRTATASPTAASSTATTGANGMAQPFHHAILPLASAADRRTEIRWGLRDFEVRFGRRPTGMWLPETAVDLATLRLLADAGITHTILAPWQVDGGPTVDTRRPVRIDLGDGRSMVAVLYDGPLSAAVSFEPARDGRRRRVRPRAAGAPLRHGPLDGDGAPLVVIATDGELYGHHQPFRDQFLARLVGRGRLQPIRPYATPSLVDGDRRGRRPPALPTATLRERTSWSCHHGIARWVTELPVRRRRLVEDPAARRARPPCRRRRRGHRRDLAARCRERPIPSAARDAYVDVRDRRADRARRSSPTCLGARRIQRHGRRPHRRVMDAQRWRLAMFASCAGSGRPGPDRDGECPPCGGLRRKAHRCARGERSRAPAGGRPAARPR